MQNLNFKKIHFRHVVFYQYNKEEFEKKPQKIHADIKKTYPQDFCCLSFVKNNTQTQEHISTNLKWEVLLHPPYSPDLAPSDFYLFIFFVFLTMK